jgi:outer membrane protein OmpA-like peptidoglycan-associated protein
MTLSLVGYADSTGQEAYNKILSVKRASEVMQNLSKKGIDSSRIKATGGGSTNFITINSNSEGRKYNRRVELNFENIPESIIILKSAKIPEKLIIK